MQIANAPSAAPKAATAPASDASARTSTTSADTPAAKSAAPAASAKVSLSQSAKDAQAADSAAVKNGDNASDSTKAASKTEHSSHHDASDGDEHGVAGTTPGTNAHASTKTHASRHGHATHKHGAKGEKDAEVDGKDGKPDSTVKSFVYGSLGLQSPEEAKKNNDSAYTAGKWLAAAVTIGGIISLII